MAEYKFGDVVLLKFPFADERNAKKRPALVLHQSTDHDIIVCRITSKLYSTLNDVKIDDWERCGLRLPSCIRVHKIAILEREIVDLKMGHLNTPAKSLVKRIFKQLVY